MTGGDSMVESQWHLMQSKTPHVCVTLVAKRGSVPQNVGAKALVTKVGLHSGTVGGGKVEGRAIKDALEMLDSGGDRFRFVTLNLTKDLGMTCGGEVKLLFERFGGPRPWNIVVFGAGHVAQALLPILAPLDCQLTCVDPRPEWMARLPEGPHITKIVIEEQDQVLEGLPSGAQVLILTKGHATDLPILKRALEMDRFSYIGVIGSRSKAHRLQRSLMEHGLTEEVASRFHCPMGLPLGGNDPQEISISIAAHLIAERDRWLGLTKDKWRAKLS